jgi:hypothetical protein
MDAGVRSPAAPRRRRVGLLAIAVGLLAAPTAWAIQLISSYVLSSVACSIGSRPLSSPLWSNLRLVLWGIDLVALVVAAAAAALAWSTWRRAHARMHADRDARNAEDARTRFLALCGALASVGFLLALVFATVGLVLLPACSR